MNQEPQTSQEVIGSLRINAPQYSPGEVIKILDNVFSQSGYRAYFENVSIGLTDKNFTVVGSVPQIPWEEYEDMRWPSRPQTLDYRQGYSAGMQEGTRWMAGVLERLEKRMLAIYDNMESWDTAERMSDGVITGKDWRRWKGVRNALVDEIRKELAELGKEK